MLGPAILRPSSRIAHSCVKQKSRRFRGLPTPACFSSSSPRSTLKGHHWRSSESGQERTVILAEKKGARVRSWDLLRGPADALTLIRAVEQKYGPVESYYFQSDFDRPDLYQTSIIINFHDVKSLLRVPETAETIHLRAPKIQARRPGGIGLDEILPLLSEDPEFLTADQVSEMSPEDRSIDFRINRASAVSFKVSPFTRTFRHKPSLTGYEMLKWGGFYDMKPIESTHPITSQDLTEEKLEHIHMRMSLRDWSHFLNVQNPYEVYPGKKTEGEGQVEPSSSSAERDEIVAESLSVSEQDWVVSKPDPARNPLKEILDMEDLYLAGVNMEPVVGNDATGVPQPVPTPSPAIDSTSPLHELELKQQPSPTTPPVAQPSSQSPTPTAEVKAQASESKEANRKVEQSIQAQLVEAKRLRELVGSAGKPKEKQNAKTKSKSRGKKQKMASKPHTKNVTNKQDAEPQSGVMGLFHRIQNLFRMS